MNMEAPQVAEIAVIECRPAVAGTREYKIVLREPLNPAEAQKHGSLTKWFQTQHDAKAAGILHVIFDARDQEHAKYVTVIVKGILSNEHAEHAVEKYVISYLRGIGKLPQEVPTTFKRRY